MLNSQDILNAIKKNRNKNYYVIDIGSSTGVKTDPCYPFITNNEFNGLCIEGDLKKIPSLQKNVSSKMLILRYYSIFFKNLFLTPG